MSDAGRKLKPTTKDTAPTLIVGVGAVTSAAPWDTPDRRVPYVLDRITFTHARRNKKGWMQPKQETFGGWRDAWDYLDSLGTVGRRVYVVAPRASDVLTVMHFWDRVRDGEVTIWDEVARRQGRGRTGTAAQSRQRHPLVLNGRPDIIGYSTPAASFRWVSVTNWCDVGMADLFNQVGMTTPPDADPLSKWEYHQWPSEQVSEAVFRYVKRLINWWTANECGTWRDTPGQAAWSSFLRAGEVDKIVQHNNERASELENRAAFGGRVGAWYFGPIGDLERWNEFADAPPPSSHGLGLAGPIHRFDVRAMYPTILRDELMPVRLIRHDSGTSIGGLRLGLKDLLALATVRLRTKRAVYPYRTRGTVAYPVGEFVTTLATPELRQALDAGEVTAVYRVAWYTPGRPFRSWSLKMLGLRDRMKAADDPVGEKFVKLLTNSMTGRLSKRKMGWNDEPSAIPVKWWGEWPHLDMRTGDAILYRSLGGHVQSMVRDSSRPPTLAAVYAHITSHGRVFMNGVRDAAGLRQVVWQDTDGVMVTELGGMRIINSPYHGYKTYGKIEHEETFACVQLLTPKHYWRDGRWTLSGVHNGFAVVGGSTAHDVVTTNPVRSAVEPGQAAVFRSLRHLDLRTIDPGIAVGDDGWAIPPAVKSGDLPADRPAGQLLLDWEGEREDA